MYDEVAVPCPGCAELGRTTALYFQTKAGPRHLTTYSLDDAPPEVIADLNGESEYCESCREGATILVLNGKLEAIPVGDVLIRLAEERKRLEREVIEAAKAFYEHASVSFRMPDLMRSVEALVAFEAKHGTPELYDS